MADLPPAFRVPGVIRNIIFDWSGTLVDDLPAVLAASNAVFRRAGVPEMSLEEFRREFRLPFKLFYDRYVPHLPLEELERWFHAAFEKAQDRVQPLPHAREFLEFCRAQGLRTLLLSSVHPRHYQRQIAATGFGAFIDSPHVAIWDKRDHIRRLLEAEELQPRETLFIGDMEHDIETARHGGVWSCAVLTGYNTLPQLRAAGPDIIVEHLGELRRLLERAALDPERLHQPPELEVAEEARCGPPVPTVGALIFNRRGEVLMVRTRKWSSLWGIPGGKIKGGEPAEEALRREIREETELEIEQIRFVLVQDCIDSEEFYRPAHFLLLNYVCRCRDGETDAQGRPHVRLNEEAQAYCWVSPEAALQLPLNRPTRILLEAALDTPRTVPVPPIS